MNRATTIVLLAAASVLAAAPAVAQWGSIFGNDPPRPPSNVPRGNQLPPPQPQAAPPPQQPLGTPRPVQSQPLPPPPGANVPLDTRPMAPQPARGTPAATVPAAPAAPVPDETITEPPAQKIVNPTAVFSGLDKITGRIITFPVQINETVRFGALEVTPRACYTRPPTEAPNTDGFVEVDELTLQGELRRIFTGWMFAASPGLNAVEHPIYDIWLADCQGGAPAVAQAPEPPPAATPPARTPRAQPPPPPQRRTQQLPPPPPPPAR